MSIWIRVHEEISSQFPPYVHESRAEDRKVFEEEGIAKGTAAVTYKGKMVDTPVYENAMQILRTMEEIKAADAKA